MGDTGTVNRLETAGRAYAAIDAVEKLKEAMRAIRELRAIDPEAEGLIEVEAEIVYGVEVCRHLHQRRTAEVAAG